MELSFINIAVRWCLSLAVVFSTPAFAGEPKLAAGSGGRLPPPTKPVTYFDGEDGGGRNGGGNGGGPDSSSAARGSTPSPFEFGQRWSTGIFAAGDGYKVFRFDNRSIDTIILGELNPKTDKIQWERDAQRLGTYLESRARLNLDLLPMMRNVVDVSTGREVRAMILWRGTLDATLKKEALSVMERAVVPVMDSEGRLRFQIGDVVSAADSARREGARVRFSEGLRLANEIRAEIERLPHLDALDKRLLTQSVEAIDRNHQQATSRLDRVDAKGNRLPKFNEKIVVQSQIVRSLGYSADGGTLVYRPSEAVRADGKTYRDYRNVHVGWLTTENGQPKVNWLNETQRIEPHLKKAIKIPGNADRIKLFERALAAGEIKNKIKNPGAIEPIQKTQTRTVPSQYPEIQSTKEPIEKSRALVVVPGEGPRPRLDVIRSKLSADESPRRFNERFRLNEATLQYMRENLQKLKNGSKNVFTRSAEKIDRGQLATSSKAAAFNMSVGAGAFYIALGVSSYMMMVMDHANNPVAMQSFMDQSQDPMFWMNLGVFMAAAGGSAWAMNKMYTKRYGQPGLGANTGIFLGSLIVATLAGTIFAEFAADPNTAKCVGFSGPRDMDACDQLWNRMTSRSDWEKLAGEQILPAFANMIVAGGLTQAVVLGAGYLFSRQAVFTALRSINFGWAKAGGPMATIVTQVATIGVFIFAYHISEKWFGVTHWVKERTMTSMPWNKDVYNDLLTEWARLRKKGFPSDEVLQKEGLLDQLQAYADFQSKWRLLQRSDVENAYVQWQQKGDSFLMMEATAKDFYANTLSVVAHPNAQGQQHPGADPSILNQEYVENYRQFQEKLGAQTWMSLKDQNYYHNLWPKVRTNNLVDFLVTSMACGPEVENYGSAPGMLSKLGGWLMNQLPVDKAPQKVGDNSSGWAARFYPPRITNDIDNGQTSACDYVKLSVAQARGAPMPTPREAELTVDGQTYPNLLSYIRQQVRPAVVENGVSKFDSWWGSFVTPIRDQFLTEWAKDYDSIIDTTFKSALHKEGHYYSERPTAKGTGLEARMAAITDNRELCPRENLKCLAYGQLNSLREELRLYLAMQTELLASVYPRLGSMAGNKQQVVQTSIEAGQRMLSLLNQLIDQTKGIDANTAAELNAITLEMRALAETQLTLFLPSPEATRDDGHNFSTPAVKTDMNLAQVYYSLVERTLKVGTETLILVSLLTKFK